MRASTLWAYLYRMLSNEVAIIALTIWNVKSEVIGSLTYCKINKLKILFLA